MEIKLDINFCQPVFREVSKLLDRGRKIFA